MIRYGLLSLLALILLSCGKSKPSGIMEPGKMELVLWDVIRANTYVTQYVSRDSTKNVKEEQARFQQKVFTVHKISKEDFYKSYDYYLAHPGQMTVMLDSMISKANTKPVTRDRKFSPVMEK